MKKFIFIISLIFIVGCDLRTNHADEEEYVTRYDRESDAYGETNLIYYRDNWDIQIYKAKGLDSLGNYVEKLISINKNTGEISESTPLRMK